MALMEVNWGSVPVGVGSYILSEWLQLKDIVHLDTASMCGSTRAILQSFLADVVKEDHFSIDSDVQCKWILRTQIQLTYLYVELAALDLELVHRVLKQCCHRASELHLSGIPSMQFAIRNMGFGSDLDLAFPHVTHLSLAGLSMNDAELLALTQNASQLTLLRMTMCDGFTSEGLRNFWEQPMSLRDIDIKSCPVHSAMSRIVSNCPHLEHLCLLQAEIPRDEMIEILTALPSLISLSLDGVADDAVLCIANTQPELQHIWLRALDETVTSQALTHLFATCRELTSVVLQDFRQFSSQHFLDMCPLMSLSIYNSSRFSDRAVVQFAQRSPALTTLCLCDCENITQELPLPILRCCPLLTSLTLINGNQAGFAPMNRLVVSLIRELHPGVRDVSVYLQERSPIPDFL